jgi:hypothetical protein
MAELPDGAVSLREAAARLGVSVETLRRRAQRYQSRNGDSPFFKHNDEWFTILAEGPDTGPDMLRDTSPSAGFSSAITPGEQFARVIEQAIAPYAQRLETIAIELGRERERREQVERELDTLLEEVAQLRLTQQPEPASDASDALGSLVGARETQDATSGVMNENSQSGASGEASAPSPKRRGLLARLFGLE